VEGFNSGVKWLMWLFCLLAGSVKKVPETYCAQDELAEILNDFKNNVYSITEIEMLVDTWRKRNDVQQSFKDKQVMTQTLNVNSLLYCKGPSISCIVSFVQNAVV
jgi:hypothetical protein